MTEDQFLDLIDPVLKPLGSTPEDGEEYRTPPLDLLRYYSRPTRVHWLPWVGWGRSVVAVARQPGDLTMAADGYTTLLNRLARAVNGRFPPTFRSGPALGMTALVITSEAITPDDDATLARVVSGRTLPGQRAVPLGLIRVNLEQDSLAFALTSGPPDAFPEPVALADALTPHFRRFVPLIRFG